MEMNYQKALKILGLTDNYTEDELKKAYYKLAKEYHPDINNDKIDAEERTEKLKEINAAKEYLESYLKIGLKEDVTTNKTSTDNKEREEEIIREFARIINDETLKYESQPLYVYLENLIRTCKAKTVQTLCNAERTISQEMIIAQMHIEIQNMFTKCSIIVKRFKALGKRTKKLKDPNITNKVEEAYNQLGKCPLELTELKLDSLEQYIKLREEKAIMSLPEARKKLSTIKDQLGALSSKRKSTIRDFREQMGRRFK